MLWCKNVFFLYKDGLYTTVQRSFFTFLFFLKQMIWISASPQKNSPSLFFFHGPFSVSLSLWPNLVTKMIGPSPTFTIGVRIPPLCPSSSSPVLPILSTAVETLGTATWNRRLRFYSGNPRAKVRGPAGAPGVRLSPHGRSWRKVSALPLKSYLHQKFLARRMFTLLGSDQMMGLFSKVCCFFLPQSIRLCPNTFSTAFRW